MDIKKPQLVKVEAFAYFFRGSSATPSLMGFKLFYMINFADDFPVVAVFDKCEHIGETCISESGINALDSNVGSDVT